MSWADEIIERLIQFSNLKEIWIYVFSSSRMIFESW